MLPHHPTSDHLLKGTVAAGPTWLNDHHTGQENSGNNFDLSQDFLLGLMTSAIFHSHQLASTYMM